jgi:hypothetical protein
MGRPKAEPEVSVREIAGKTDADRLGGRVNALAVAFATRRSSLSARSRQLRQSAVQRLGARSAAFTASTPSIASVVVKPAFCSRLLTSFGTSRPLVSLFGLPV